MSSREMGIRGSLFYSRLVSTSYTTLIIVLNTSQGVESMKRRVRMLIFIVKNWKLFWGTEVLGGLYLTDFCNS